MDEIKDTPGCADRYWNPEACELSSKPLSEMTGSERRAWEQATNTSFIEAPKNFKTLEFAPEPMHMIEIKSKKIKLTVGNKYPIMERKESYNREDGFDFSEYAYVFKTKNDEGKEIWIDDKYFIPGEIKLTHEEALGGFHAKKDPLEWDGNDYAADGLENLCDIRKMATEKNVKPLEVNEKQDEDFNVLSGLKDSDYDGHPYHYPTKTACRRKMKWPVSETYSITEGVVRDYGNDLINNPDKCMAAIDKVFGSDKVADPDEIIVSINRFVPHLRLSWEDRMLCVSDAQTKISYTEIQTAYAGLKSLVSANVAKRTIGKLVASKIEKLF